MENINKSTLQRTESQHSAVAHLINNLFALSPIHWFFVGIFV